MTTHPGVTDHEEDMIRYKNLINQAVDDLKHQGMGEEAAQRFLGELFDLKNNREFWNGVSHGLAVYTDGETTRMFRLAEPVESSVTVGDQYNVRHVALSTSRADTLDVLLVSMEAARVMRASVASGHVRTLEPLETKFFPMTYDDVITARDPEEQLQHHSVRRLGVFTPAARRCTTVKGRGNRNSKPTI